MLPRISGDLPQNTIARIAYMAANAVRNARPYATVHHSLKLVDFRCGAGSLLHDLPGTPSPSRALSDLFWMTLPWQELERALGPLCAFDVGCGSGAFGVRLRRWSGNRIARYVGLDVRSNDAWQELQRAEAGFSFVQAPAEQVLAAIPAETNLIVSQSALEHLPDDERCLGELTTFAEQRRAPVLQIHLVPSQACLWLYRLHGFRQYTPRSVSRICRRVATRSECVLVRLGGRASTTLHRQWITGVDRRPNRPEEYRQKLAEALDADARGPHDSPAFYAFVIYTNPQMPMPLGNCW